MRCDKSSDAACVKTTHDSHGCAGDVDDGAGNALAAVVTRFTETLSGDLGAQVDQDGTATLSLSNPHGDAVTTVTIPAGQSQDVAAVAIGGWADYTEYGAPTEGTDPATLSSVAGAIGYGWLGAKQRSTSVESAGLTLMGVRLYNSRRGLFTAIDPVEGGNENSFTYPNDPVNAYDLDGRAHCGSKMGCQGTAVASRARAGGSAARGCECKAGNRPRLPSNPKKGTAEHSKATKKNPGMFFPNARAAWRAARAWARKLTRGNIECRVRGVCEKGNHVHVDVYRVTPGSRLPEKVNNFKLPRGVRHMKTYHFRW